MDSITALTKNLTDTIHASDEYIEYMKYKKIVNSNLAIKDKINSFKRMQLEMNCNSNILQEDKKKLQSMYTELTLDENIDMYLKYEISVFKTISYIYDSIVDSVEMDLDFME